MLNALTVDLEDWYHTNDFNLEIAKWGSFEDRIRKSTELLLEVLARYQVKGTFFVLGCIAEKHPDLIRMVAAGGHEIASHGGWHQMVNRMTPEVFRKDLVYSRDVLEEVVGRKITSYRAPSWSIDKGCLWALSILEEEGFTCDSSMQPFRTPLSGIANGPREPFYPVIDGKKLNLIEFPPTTIRFWGHNIPFSGGFYLRLLPPGLLKMALAKVNNYQDGMIYIHPWELDYEQPRLEGPVHIKFVHYYNLKNTRAKLENLLKYHKFVPLGEVLKTGSYPELELNRGKANYVNIKK